MRVSIDIDEQNINVAQGLQKGNRIIVKNTIRLKTPPFTMHDGEILNVELLYDVLKNSFFNNKIKGDTVCLNINSTTIITRELTIPKTNKAQAIQMISNEMFQSSNVTAKYVIDYVVTDVIINDKIESYKVLAAAIPQHIVEGYAKLCSMLDFRKQIINIEFYTIYKMFTMQLTLAAKVKPIIIASIDASNCTFLIIENNKIVFAKTIALNINKYINLTSDKKTIDYKKIDFTTTQGENKRKLIESFAYDLAQEISKIIQFKLSKSEFTTIEDIYLFGEITNAGGIEKRLSEILDTKIKTISKPYCVKTKLNFKFNQYITTIGGLIKLK